jgi:murein L,D-transpeptidase YafK
MTATKVVVVKSEKQMFLLDDTGIPFRTYDIAMGGDPVGPKQCEGDMKTPEGLYTIETRNPESKYHLSLKISYPNEQDVAQAESMGLSPGGDIFIHGAPNEAFLGGFFYQYKPAWTQGCIAVRNSDIEEMWSLVSDGTPIEILP